MLSTNNVVAEEGMEPWGTTAALKVHRIVSKLTELQQFAALKLLSLILNVWVFEVIVWVWGSQLYCLCWLSSPLSLAAAGRDVNVKAPMNALYSTCSPANSWQMLLYDSVVTTLAPFLF